MRREWGEAETGLIWSMAGWFGTGSGCQGIVRGLSGDRQGIVRGSIWWMGACAVISGVIVSPAGISGPAPGALIHSCSFVRSFVGSGGSGSGGGGGGGCDDMRRRYGATICTTDMQGLKTEKAKSVLLLAPDGLLL